MEIDIRHSNLSKIRYADEEWLELYNLSVTDDNCLFDIKDSDGNEFTICLSDTPNLIKALQKAQELWGK